MKELSGLDFLKNSNIITIDILLKGGNEWIEILRQALKM